MAQEDSFPAFRFARRTPDPASRRQAQARGDRRTGSNREQDPDVTKMATIHTIDHSRGILQDRKAVPSGGLPSPIPRPKPTFGRGIIVGLDWPSLRTNSRKSAILGGCGSGMANVSY